MFEWLVFYLLNSLSLTLKVFKSIPRFCWYLEFTNQTKFGQVIRQSELSQTFFSCLILSQNSIFLQIKANMVLKSEEGYDHIIFSRHLIFWDYNLENCMHEIIVGLQITIWDQTVLQIKKLQKRPPLKFILFYDSGLLKSNYLTKFIWSWPSWEF